jgi:hypothetical protein
MCLALTASTRQIRIEIVTVQPIGGRSTATQAANARAHEMWVITNILSNWITESSPTPTTPGSATMSSTVSECATTRTVLLAWPFRTVVISPAMSVDV